MVTFLTVLCILVPAWRVSSRASLLKMWPLSVLFGCLGLGFMFIEVTQMQRLILLLGHPIYGLSVILFSLLVFAGLGSFFTVTIKELDLTRQGVLRLASIPIVLAICGAITPYIVTQFQSHQISTAWWLPLPCWRRWASQWVWRFHCRCAWPIDWRQI